MKSLTAWLEKARDLIRHEPIRDDFYTSDEDGQNGLSLNMASRTTNVHVCSVGAMRLTFVQMMGDDPSLCDANGRVNEEKVKNHPFYEEGMRLLGKAFYKDETITDHMLDHQTKGALVGRNVDPIETSVMNINDDRNVEWETIWSAFDEAVELARAKERADNAIVAPRGHERVLPMEPADEPNGNKPLTQAELELMLEARDSARV